ncbi:MAG: lysoplasmalogenase [Candidatus Aminicenantes bacterium]|nr:lysoplasmalogenase [Candidatus Aminicenantes bacterium]
MRLCLVLLASAAAAAAGTILADAKGRWRLVYVFKPLTMSLVIALAAVRVPLDRPAYKTFILAGLAASLLGDVFMMLRRKRFVEGLAAFLLAHGFYIAAFVSTTGARLSLGTVWPFLVYAIVMMRIVLPRAGRMKGPIVVYIIVITLMAALAADRHILLGGAMALSAFAGALLFVISDSVLAANRFVKKIPFAQALFALSV